MVQKEKTISTKQWVPTIKIACYKKQDKCKWKDEQVHKIIDLKTQRNKKACRKIHKENRY